ncbi:MAG TPA: hypothetical protein VFY20_13230 [Gemmatimonadales bacterium]|nr:hypothetical protein [Gemmatimonadales bacterium]
MTGGTAAGRHDGLVEEGAFDRALERLRPMVRAYGFRLVGVQRPQRLRHGFAEYHRNDRRLCLVWESRAQALWVETARASGFQIVSRWQDVEWSVAGKRLPLDCDTSDERIDRLLAAVLIWLDAARPMSS